MYVYHVCMCVYIYIYTHKYDANTTINNTYYDNCMIMVITYNDKHGVKTEVGATYCTPEIDTSEIIKISSGIFHRKFTCPVDFYLNCPMGLQRHFPTYCCLCDVWCILFSITITSSNDY